jgi:transglutaminase-like putative cysteine protease
MTDDSTNTNFAECLAPTPFIERDAPAVQAFVARVAGDAQTDVDKAVRLFYAVRDEIRYDPYGIVLTVDGLKATTTLETGRGFCISKAVLLAAAARAAGIPARLGFADVRNHLTTERLKAEMGTDVFAYHGFTELWLGGRWIKATPTFNRTLCERFGVKTLDFDGKSDAVFHSFDAAGKRHMEYVRDRGHAIDVPLEDIEGVWREFYPDLPSGEPAAATGDFEREAEEDAARKA